MPGMFQNTQYCRPISPELENLADRVLKMTSNGLQATPFQNGELKRILPVITAHTVTEIVLQ